jgi:hypothetical protein
LAGVSSNFWSDCGTDSGQGQSSSCPRSPPHEDAGAPPYGLGLFETLSAGQSSVVEDTVGVPLRYEVPMSVIDTTPTLACVLTRTKSRQADDTATEMLEVKAN